MSEEKNEITTPDFYTKAEAYFEENKKPLSIAGGAVLLIVAALLYVSLKWLPERNLSAQREMYMAEMWFAQDSFNLALNGNGVNKGFLQIMEQYNFTKAAKLSAYYSGICYLNLGDHEKALQFLDKFSSSDKVVQAVKLSAMGDAAMSSGKPDEGIQYYRKAADASDNEVFTPFFLKKAGMACEYSKQFADAAELYEKVQQKYPNSEEARDIERYLIRARAAAGE